MNRCRQISSIRSAGSSSTTVIAHRARDRKSTRLNSSHTVISYAVFCLKKKNTQERSILKSMLIYVDTVYKRYEQLTTTVEVTRAVARSVEARGEVGTVECSEPGTSTIL